MGIIKAVYDFNSARLNLSDRISKFQDVFHILPPDTHGYSGLEEEIGKLVQAMVEMHGSSNVLIQEFDKYIEEEHDL